MIGSIKTMKILIAEDEKDLRELLVDQLTEAGYDVVQAQDGKEALKLFHSEIPDMAILDVMMPFLDGFSVLTRIRETSRMPVIFLTARGDEIDKVSGLRLGADDYLVKPWSINELLARIEVQKRHIRTDTPEEEIMTSGGLMMDFTNGVITKNGEVVNLNAKEYHILKFFAENRGKIVTKKQIYQAAWQEDYLYDNNTVTVHLSHLRSKIEDDSEKHIETLIGIGYRFN